MSKSHHQLAELDQTHSQHVRAAVGEPFRVHQVSVWRGEMGGHTTSGRNRCALVQRASGVSRKLAAEAGQEGANGESDKQYISIPSAIIIDIDYGNFQCYS